MEQQKKEMDTSKLRGMFEGAHIENCTQNFIWDNEVVNVYGKDEVKEINSADISDEKLRECINKILPLMKNSNRKWFCVAKVIMLRGLAPIGDFESVGNMLKRLYPGGVTPKYDAPDLLRMHIGSFMLPVSEWVISDAPIKRRAEFIQYVELAQKFDNLLAEK